MKETVVVGLSGGVDSSVSAKILKDLNYNVIGVFVKIWSSDDPHCSATEDSVQARIVADTLGIPFYSFDFSETYKKKVFAQFLSDNTRYWTPNPDVLCNKYIKFGVMLDIAQELGASKIATGHYAHNTFNPKTNKWELLIPKDTDKDQTYFLHTFQQDQLKNVLFPLAPYTKSEVRNFARKWALHNAERKDSTGICMVGERPYTLFLKEYFREKKGDMVDENGVIVHEHRGLCFYTIGQRRELGIGGKDGYPELPWYVIKKIPESNTLIVSQNEDLLYQKTLKAINATWIAGSPPSEERAYHARVRYRQNLTACRVKIGTNNDIEFIFETPQRAIAPGQSVVLYDGDVCLGGATITDS